MDKSTVADELAGLSHLTPREARNKHWAPGQKVLVLGWRETRGLTQKGMQTGAPGRGPAQNHRSSQSRAVRKDKQLWSLCGSPRSRAWHEA